MANTNHPLPPLFPPHLDALLTRLHAASLAQESAIDPTHRAAIASQETSDPTSARLALDALMRDKFIALDQDKCLFAHHAMLAAGATCAVEVGTSFGVSTVYLAHAAAANAARLGKRARVVGTEKEEGKAAVARAHWREAGREVEEVVELRVGDLRETLQEDLEGVEFVLMDIWPYMVVPALKALLPKMKPGCIIVTDNTEKVKGKYKEYLDIIRDRSGKFQSICLPYDGGLEFTVYWP